MKKFTRKKNVIIEHSLNEKNEAVQTPETFPSINKAKLKSRELQKAGHEVRRA